MDHTIVFRLQFRAAVREQELDERIEELNIALSRLKGERVHLRSIFAYAVHLSAVQLHHALIARTDVEDVGKAAVLLLKGNQLVAMHTFSGPRWSDD